MTPAAETQAQAEHGRWSRRVIERLDALNLSRRRLGRAVGVSHQTISRALSGAVSPSFALVAAVNHFLDLDTSSATDPVGWAEQRSGEQWGAWRDERWQPHGRLQEDTGGPDGDGDAPGRGLLNASQAEELTGLLVDAQSAAAIAVQVLRGRPPAPPTLRSRAEALASLPKRLHRFREVLDGEEPRS